MSDEEALRRDALQFLQQHLAPTLDDANTRGENPAVVLYALLEGAMRVCQGPDTRAWRPLTARTTPLPDFRHACWHRPK